MLNSRKTFSVATMGTGTRIAIALSLFFSSFFLFAQETEEGLLQKWRDTLQFGIDSSVIGAIDQMQEAGEDELNGVLLEIFPGARSTVQTRIIDFFLHQEDGSLRDLIEWELMFYQDLPIALVRKYLTYLEKHHPSSSEDMSEVLIEISENTNPELVAAALRVLYKAARIPEASFYLELFEADGQNTSVRVEALEALGEFRGDEVIDFLEDIAEDETQEGLIRQTAIKSLGKIAASRSLALFRRLLEAQDPYIRTSVLSALADYGESETLDLYRSALRDSFWRMRLAVLQTLQGQPIHELEAMVVYIARNDPETPVKTQAYRTLGAYKTPGAWQTLEQDLENPRLSESYKLQILEMLIQNRFSESRSKIEAIMEAEWAKPNSRLLDMIGRTLSAGTFPEAADIFLRFLDHKETVIKIYGARGLGNSAVRSHIERLEELDADGIDNALRQNVQRALEKLR